jgi:hypothetical protein
MFETERVPEVPIIDAGLVKKITIGVIYTTNIVSNKSIIQISVIFTKIHFIVTFIQYIFIVTKIIISLTLVTGKVQPVENIHKK